MTPTLAQRLTVLAAVALLAAVSAMAIVAQRGTGEETAAGWLRSGGGAARGAETGGCDAIGSLGTGASRAIRGCAKRRLVTVG